MSALDDMRKRVEANKSKINSNNSIQQGKALEEMRKRVEEKKKEIEKNNEENQLINEYIENNGVEKINEEYKNYMQSVNNTIAPKLYNTNAMKSLISKKNIITPQEVQDIKDYDNLPNINKIGFDTYKTAKEKDWANSRNVVQRAVANQMGLKSEKSDWIKTPENLKDNLKRFEDGYNFGDVTKTIGETAGETLLDIGATIVELPTRAVKGALSVSEGIAQAGASAIAGVSDLIGQDKFANALRKQIANTNPITGGINKFNENLDKYTFTGETLDSTSEGIGQSLAQMATGYALNAVKIPATIPIKFGKHVLNMPITAFITGTGSSAQETYQKAEQQLNGIENATWKEKVQMSLKIVGGGAIEGVSEGMFGLLGVGGSDITDEIAKKAISRATTAFDKQLVNIMIAGGGEALEEFISYAGNWLWNNGIVNNLGNIDYSQNWNWDDVMQQMTSAFLSAGISQGGTSIIQTNKATQNAEKYAQQLVGRTLTQDEKTAIKNNVTDMVLGAKQNLEKQSMYPATQKTIDTQIVDETKRRNAEYLKNKYGLNVNQDGTINNQPTNLIDRLKQKYNLQNEEYKISESTQNNTNFAKTALTNKTFLQNNVQNVSNLQKTVQNNSNIQGLEDYTEQDIKDLVSDYIEDLDANVQIKGIAINGSRARGDSQVTSDLDVVVEYDGDMSEDALFNILNEEPLTIDGIQVDINPITASKSGTLEQYMKKSQEYDAQKYEESDVFEDKANYDVDINSKNNYNINNEDTELYDDGRATRMGGLVNEFKDKLTSKQWNTYFKRIDNDGKKYNFGNNEKSVIPIGNKLVFSNYINGKPQVYDIVKLESRLLKTYGMTAKQFSDIFINKLVKEGYNETEIREFIRNLGEETLFERNDTSSNITTNRSERTSKNDRQVDRTSENRNERKQLLQEDGKLNSNNDVENSEEQGSFSMDEDIRYDKKNTKKNKNEENTNNFELTRDNILTRIRNEIGIEEFSNDKKELLEIASEIRNKIKDKSLTIDEIENIVGELGSVLTVKIDDFDIAVEDFINDVYGDGSWDKITTSVLNEIKQFRDEYEREYNILETGKKAIVASPEIRDVLKQAGFTDFEIYDPANAYIQNILETLEKDKDYYSKTLKQIEQEALTTGEKRMNTILNKRRYDVQSGKTSANPNYLEGTSLRSMRKEIEKYLGKKVGIKGFRARAYGIYKMNLDTIRVKDISNMETTVHELGHRINYRELDKDLKGASRDELNKLAERAFANMYDDTPDVKLQEGWAEFTKRFVVDNQTTLKEYPELSNYMLEQLSRNPRVEKLITTLIDMAEQYVNAPTETQIRKMQSIGEDTGKIEDRKFFDKYMYEVHDDLWDIKQMTRAFAKSMNTSIWKLAPSDNIYNLMRALRANEDRVLNVMKFGLIDDSGIRRTKGMAEIMEKLNNDSEKLQKVRDLLIAMRTLDYASVNLETGLSPEEALSLIAKYSKEKDIMDAANDIINFQEEIMKYAVSKGLMKVEDYKEMKKWNKLYIPLKRVFEGKNNSSNSKMGAGNLTKRRTGSARQIIDPFESIIQNTAMILTKINQNEIIKTLADLQHRTGLADYFEEVDPSQRLKAEVNLGLFKNVLEEEGIDTDEIDLDVVKRIFSPVMNDDKTMTIGYMDGGKLKAIEFKDKNIYDVITGADNGLISKTNMVLNALDKFTGLLRMGATTGNLEFALPNMVADTTTAWIFSESGFIPAVDTMRGLVDYMVANYDWAGKLVKEGKYKQNNKYMYDLYKQSGATMATRVASYRPEVQEYVLEVFGKHVNDLMSADLSKAKKAGKAILNGILKAPQKVQDILSIIPELSEQATRFESFKKDYNYFKKKGYSHKNALLQATVNTRDITMDFNRMGHSMRAYNRIKAFSAARAQGIYRFIEGVEKMPKKVLSKVGILTAISLSILAMANSSGNDKEKEITDQKRKDNFIIPLGPNGDIITIKKPQGTVRSILNFAELIYNVGTGKIKEENYNQAWLNWVRDTVEENSPIELDLKEGNDFFNVISSASLPTALEPITENALNRDFYYGNPIIPYGKEDLRPEDQYDENTSQTAILIGKALKQSPAKIENLITGWFAGVGQQTLDISDFILGKAVSSIPEAPTKNKDEAFITKRFFVSGYKNSESISQVYDMVDKLEDLKEYNEATEEQLEQLKQLNTAKETMSILNKKMKAVRNNLSLSAKEKQKEILRLQELRTDTARYYLGKPLIENTNKIQIELYEYYPSSTEYIYAPNKGMKVKVQYTELDQKRYAEIWKETYEEELLKFETSKKYYTMTDEEREKEKESIREKARNKAQDEVSKEVYEREH